MITSRRHRCHREINGDGWLIGRSQDEVGAAACVAAVAVVGGVDAARPPGRSAGAPTRLIRVVRPGDFVVRTDIAHDDMRDRLFLLIRGVRVEFRSCDPVGLDRAREAIWEQFRREVATPST